MTFFLGILTGFVIGMVVAALSFVSLTSADTDDRTEFDEYWRGE